MDISWILTHEGENRKQYFNAIVPPIIQTSNFKCDTVAEFRAAFEDEYNTHLYTRGNNPTVEILRKKLAALEGAEDALVTGSGSAAIAVAVMGNLSAGDHIVCVEKPYSWTHKLLTKLLVRYGVAYTFVDGTAVENIEKAIRPTTKVLFLESPNSLTYELQDLEACAKLAKKYGLVSMIDNSYCSPLYQNPIAYGIDIVIHSGTKYLNGHSDVVFGAICGTTAMMQKLFHTEWMALGTTLSPHDAWLVLRGLRTLSLRIEKSQENTLALIQFLENHPKVASILYPLHPSFPQYELARQQMRGAGGLFSVNFKADSMGKMEAFANAMADTFAFAVSWGGYESLQIPTCTFYNMSNEPPPLPYTFVRYYVGIEDISLLKTSFEQALELL